MKKSTFWKDFKDFIAKGDVLSLAIGVVIGGAFGKITSGLVSFIINPLISIFTDGADLSGSLKTIIHDEVVDKTTGEVTQPEVALLWGDWLQTIIDFLIIALCLFIILRVVTKSIAKLNEKKATEAAAAAAAKAEEDRIAAEAAAAEAAKVAAEKQAIEDQFYANVKEQTELLREIRESMKK